VHFLAVLTASETEVLFKQHFCGVPRKGNVPSVLWHCWLGGRKGIPPVKKLELWGTGMVICLERDADLHMAQLMPLTLTVSCFSKIQIGFTFLVLAHPGSPGKRAIKRVCVCVCSKKRKIRNNWRRDLALPLNSNSWCQLGNITHWTLLFLDVPNDSRGKEQSLLLCLWHQYASSTVSNKRWCKEIWQRHSYSDCSCTMAYSISADYRCPVMSVWSKKTNNIGRNLLCCDCASTAPVAQTHSSQLHNATANTHTHRNHSTSVKIKKSKVAHTRLPSVGFWSWSRFLAVSLQVTWVKPRGRLLLLSASYPRNP